MDLFSTAKEALKLARAIGDIPLQQTIIDLQEQVFDLQQKHKERTEKLEDQVKQLSEENRHLTDVLNRRETMKKGNDHLWEVKDNEVIDGPFCVTCWEQKYKAVSMLWDENRCDMICPFCKIPLMAMKPPKEWKDSRRPEE